MEGRTQCIAVDVFTAAESKFGVLKKLAAKIKASIFSCGDGITIVFKITTHMSKKSQSGHAMRG